MVTYLTWVFWIIAVSTVLALLLLISSIIHALRSMFLPRLSRHPVFYNNVETPV